MRTDHEAIKAVDRHLSHAVRWLAVCIADAGPDGDADLTAAARQLTVVQQRLARSGRSAEAGRPPGTGAVADAELRLTALRHRLAVADRDEDRVTLRNAIGRAETFVGWLHKG